MPTPVTTNRSYQKPDPLNDLDVDVLRLAAALDAIDVDMEAALDALAGKAPTVHVHVIADVTGLQDALDGKAVSAHTHTFDQLTDVNVAAAAAGMFLRFVAGEWIGVSFDASMIASGTINQARLPAHLDTSALAAAYAAATHTHAISNVTGLQTALDGKASTASVSAKLDKGGDALTGALNAADYEIASPKFKDYALTTNSRGSISGAQTIDYSAGNYVSATVTAATQFSVTNPPASGITGGFMLELTNGGAYAITWMSGTKWDGGSAPALTSSGIDLLSFVTRDGGTTWRGVLVSKDNR
jgi:Phage tail repeat like